MIEEKRNEEEEISVKRKKRQSKEQQNSEHRYTEISLSKKRSKTDFLFFGNNRKADDKIYSPTDLLEVGWSTNRPRHDEPVKTKNGFLVFLTGLPSSYSKENLEDKLSEMDFTFPKYINLSRKSSFKPFLRHALLGFEIEEDAQGAIKELHKFTFDNSGSEYKLQAAFAFV
eukprot:maker-scaffold_13-snap-gene-8.0-mRNA-1 protein AED:0.00 eAED:0.00 QI:20/1/1/1/1/1/2/87/170